MAKLTVPAFPQPCTSYGYASDSEYQIAGGGMTLRDYFAAKALCALVASINGSATEHHSWTAQNFADESYQLADAMLIARDKAPAEVSDE